MQDTLILGAYWAALFAGAYMAPVGWIVVRCVLGYASFVLLGLLVLGLGVPEVTDLTLYMLNGGVKCVWNLTEE